MGGDIACRSTEGRGSTFTFHLELPEADLPASTGYQRSGPHEAPLKGLRILVAEDNVINQQVTLSVLGGFGAQAEVAGNGLEALEALQRFEYDLVLMDDRMPEMDGLTAVGRIRAMGNPIPIIAVTAHAMKGDRERYLVEGMNGYVTKPVEPDALLHEIERVLSARQQPAPVGPVTPVVSRPVTFDVERFRRLFSNKEDLCRSIGIEFISQTKEKFAKAMTALESEDRQAVADIFHNIAGSAGNLGAQRLGRLCRDLETQSEAGEDFAALAAAAFEALQEYRKVEHLLTRTLQLQEA